MSHAAYVFLLAIEDGEPEEMMESAVQAYDAYAEHACDENNWATPAWLQMKDGRVYDLEKKQEIGTVTVEPSEDVPFPMQLPADERWEAVQRFAMGCVVVELGLRGSRYSFGVEPDHPTDGMTSEELLAYVKTEAPKRIVAGMQATPWPATTGSFDMPFYELKLLTRGYLHLADSRHPPFADASVTPYEYRAFDLTDGNEPTAMLVVDIHT